MKNKKLFYLFLSISIFIFILIIYFSLSNIKKSTAQSDVVTDVIVPVLPPSNPITGEDLKPFYQSNEFKVLIRKLIGHFGLFFAFSIFVNLTFMQTKLKNKIFIISTLGIGLFVSCLSELLQLVAGGRSSNLKDIFIDYGGYLVAFSIFVIYLIVKYKKQKKIKEVSNA